MRDKYLMRFIRMWMPQESGITEDVYFSEACYQRDTYRGKLKDYFDNGRNKNYLPSRSAKEYVIPIMQNLQKRTALEFEMYDTNYRHPQPAYVVLAAWYFLLASDDKINKFWENLIKEDIRGYLPCCTSMPGLFDSLAQHLHDMRTEMQPVTLFDLPIADAPKTATDLPVYVPRTVAGRGSVNYSHNEYHYHEGSKHEDHSQHLHVNDEK